MGKKGDWQQYLLKIVEQLQGVKNCCLLNVRMILRSTSTTLGSGGPIVASLEVLPTDPEAAAEACYGAQISVLQVLAVSGGPCCCPQSSAHVIATSAELSRAGVRFS